MGSIVECCLFEEENEKIIIEILQTEPLKINPIPLKIKEEEFESDESDESEDDPLDSSEEEFEIVILN
jgi:16S rRNA C967 or C1407 C5-methylase (RsmB/RsmF family)